VIRLLYGPEPNLTYSIGRLMLLDRWSSSEMAQMLHSMISNANVKHQIKWQKSVCEFTRVTAVCDEFSLDADNDLFYQNRTTWHLLGDNFFNDHWRVKSLVGYDSYEFVVAAVVKRVRILWILKIKSISCSARARMEIRKSDSTYPEIGLQCHRLHWTRRI